MDFYKRAREVCLKIPYGRVATYGQIALLCGAPQSARRVGFFLGHHAGTELPAHRVVNARGYLSGAASFETPDLQRWLLEQEGVSVGADETVDLKTFGWKHTLADAEAFRASFARQNI